MRTKLFLLCLFVSFLVFSGCGSPGPTTKEVHVVAVVLSNISASTPRIISVPPVAWGEYHFTHESFSNDTNSLFTYAYFIDPYDWIAGGDILPLALGINSTVYGSLADTPNFYGDFMYERGINLDAWTYSGSCDSSPSEFAHEERFGNIFYEKGLYSGDDVNITYGGPFVPPSVEFGSVYANGITSSPLLSHTNLTIYQYALDSGFCDDYFSLPEPTYQVYWNGMFLENGTLLYYSRFGELEFYQADPGAYVVTLNFTLNTTLYNNTLVEAYFNTSNPSDTSPPQLLSLSAPRRYDGSGVNISFSLSDDALDAVEVFWSNGTAWNAAVVVNASSDYNASFTPQGTAISVRVRANDTVGNEQNWTVSPLIVQEQQVTLTASATSPASPQTPIVVNGTILDASGNVMDFAGVDVYVDGVQTARTYIPEGEEQYSVTITPSSLTTENISVRFPGVGPYASSEVVLSDAVVNYSIDAAITNLSVPDIFLYGNNTINFTIVNVGSSAISGTVNTTTQLQNDGPVLQNSSSFSLSPGESQNVSMVIFLDIWRNGNYAVLSVELEAAGDENPNNDFRNITRDGFLDKDLSVDFDTIQSTVGELTVVPFTITNEGIRAASDVEWEVSFSRNAITYATYTGTIPTIWPLDESAVNINYTFPGAGTWTVQYNVSSSDEKRLDNNDFSDTIFVSSLATNPVDLRVNMSAPSGYAVVGQGIPAYTVITNDGSQVSSSSVNVTWLYSYFPDVFDDDSIPASPDQAFWDASSLASTSDDLSEDFFHTEAGINGSTAGASSQAPNASGAYTIGIGDYFVLTDDASQTSSVLQFVDVNETEMTIEFLRVLNGADSTFSLLGSSVSANPANPTSISITSSGHSYDAWLYDESASAWKLAIDMNGDGAVTLDTIPVYAQNGSLLRVSNRSIPNVQKGWYWVGANISSSDDLDSNSTYPQNASFKIYSVNNGTDGNVRYSSYYTELLHDTSVPFSADVLNIGNQSFNATLLFYENGTNTANSSTFPVGVLDLVSYIQGSDPLSIVPQQTGMRNFTVVLDAPGDIDISDNTFSYDVLVLPKTLIEMSTNWYTPLYYRNVYNVYPGLGDILWNGTVELPNITGGFVLNSRISGYSGILLNYSTITPPSSLSVDTGTWKGGFVDGAKQFIVHGMRANFSDVNVSVHFEIASYNFTDYGIVAAHVNDTTISGCANFSFSTAACLGSWTDLSNVALSYVDYDDYFLLNVDGNTSTNYDAYALSVPRRFDGNSTNMSSLPTNLTTNLTIEKARFGKIIFTSEVNISRLRNLTPENLTSLIRVQDKNITVDESLLELLDADAILTFNDVDYVNPQVYRNGVLCDESHCGDTDYDNSSGEFNVTVSGFSSYTVEEGEYCGDNICQDSESSSSCSADCPASSSPSSGGGGGGAIPKKTTTTITDTKKASCTPSWSCVWSACENGQQTYFCSDKNNCGVNTGKPSEVPKSCETNDAPVFDVSEKDSSKSFSSPGPGFLSLVFFALVIVGGGLFFVFHTNNKTYEASSKVFERPKGVIPTEPDPYQAGRDYVRAFRGAGHTEDEIKQKLRDRGWSDDDIARVL